MEMRFDICEKSIHEAVLGRLWGYLGPCWLKVIGLGIILAPIWGVLGSSWVGLGRGLSWSLCVPGRVLGYLESLFNLKRLE